MTSAFFEMCIYHSPACLHEYVNAGIVIRLHMYPLGRSFTMKAKLP